MSPQAVIRSSPSPACAAAAAPASRRPTSGAPARRAEPHARYVVANGFEADPGAQVDRTLMERDPHAVLEGVALAAYAVGAARPSSPCAPARRPPSGASAAVAAAEERGYIGTDALGTGFDLHVEVRRPGGFVVGEETVLLRAIENKRAQPDQRPPYPSRAGLWGRPTSSTTSRRWRSCPGSSPTARRLRRHRRPGRPGTTLVQLSGAVRKPGHRRGAPGHAAPRADRRSGGVATASSRPCSSAARRAASCRRRARHAVHADGAGEAAPSGLGHARGRRRDDVPRRHRHAADPLPVRRVVRQDHPVPHRRAPAVRDRPARDQRPVAADRRRSSLRDLAADIRDGGAVRPRGLRTQPAPDGDAILRREFEDHIVAAPAQPACASPSPAVPWPSHVLTAHDRHA